MTTYLMGIDHGGTSMKAVLFDLEGHVIASAHRSTPMLMAGPGQTERDMELLWQKHCEIIRECLERSGIDPKDLLGLSFSGHGKGMYLWGKDEKPARAGIVSTDSRAHAIVKKWYDEGIAKQIYPLTNQNILASQPVALLKWVLENEPGVLENTKYVFGIKDYVRYRMTGEAYAEITDMSGSSMVNLKKAAYEPEVLEALGISCVLDKLPPLVYPAESCGKVTAECAALTGLCEGTPVAAGLFDIDACAVGMDIHDDSRIAVIAGTWAINEYISKQPVTNGYVKMNSIYALPGYYLAEECAPTSASNYDWFLNQLMREAAQAAGENLYAWANAAVDSVAPDGQELLYLPYIFGGNDDPRSKATLIGLEARHTRADILRAVCEGVVFEHRRQVNRLVASRDVPPEAIRLAGGVVRAPGWVQMFADILGFPIETIDVEELGTLGAAMTAAVAGGVYGSLNEAAAKMVRLDRVYQPNPANKEIYDAKFARYERVEAAMRAYYAGE